MIGQEIVEIYNKNWLKSFDFGQVKMNEKCQAHYRIFVTEKCV